MIRYVITTHARLPGVGLSRVGSWGNIRYSSDEAAICAVKADAGRAPYKVERVKA